MRRIGGVIRCVLRVWGVSNADQGLSGYAALTRPTYAAYAIYPPQLMSRRYVMPDIPVKAQPSAAGTPLKRAAPYLQRYAAFHGDAK